MPRPPRATISSLRACITLVSFLLLPTLTVVACGGASTQSSAAAPTVTAIPTVALDASLAQQTVYVASLGQTVSSKGAIFALSADTGAQR
jgi:hypothetical protein